MIAPRTSAPPPRLQGTAHAIPPFSTGDVIGGRREIPKRAKAVLQITKKPSGPRVFFKREIKVNQAGKFQMPWSPKNFFPGGPPALSKFQKIPLLLPFVIPSSFWFRASSFPLHSS
jgi:hypothetical protein